MFLRWLITAVIDLATSVAKSKILQKERNKVSRKRK